MRGRKALSGLPSTWIAASLAAPARPPVLLVSPTESWRISRGYILGAHRPGMAGANAPIACSGWFPTLLDLRVAFTASGITLSFCYLKPLAAQVPKSVTRGTAKEHHRGQTGTPAAGLRATGDYGRSERNATKSCLASLRSLALLLPQARDVVVLWICILGDEEKTLKAARNNVDAFFALARSSRCHHIHCVRLWGHGQRLWSTAG